MTTHRRTALLACATLVLALSAAAAADEDSSVGTKAPDWQLDDWINSPPLARKDLAGKVVLVRWWTAPGCALCRATAPALNEFHERYAARGLVVVGAYHHKADGPLDVEKVKASARELGFRFPVAVDRDWKTLRAWWLDGGERRYTSVSFLIDRRGVIRHVHPGGRYVKGDKAYAALKEKIEELLAEKPAD